MSGSETGVMTSREPFSVGLQKGPVQLQNMRLGYNADGSSVYQPVGASSPTYQSSVPGPIAGTGGYNGIGGEEGSAGGGHIASSGLNMNMSSGHLASSGLNMNMSSGHLASSGLNMNMSSGHLVSSGLNMNMSSGHIASSGLNMNMSSGHIASSGLNMNMSSESMKRKRGRPRKYGPDGSMALALTPTPPSATVTQSSGGFSSPTTTVPPPSGGSAPPPSTFKKRGRPLGSTSSKKQRMESLGSMGVGFTPHVITVMAGEDVSSKIMSFSQRGTRAVCVLSANGAISNVTLRQAATSGGSVTYEGRFEILSLSGSFLLTENAGARGRTGGLSVSLSGPDGRVLGGSVAGLLTAASPVQVVVGSFAADGRKEVKHKRQIEPLYAATNLPHCGPTGTSSPPSRGTLSESSGGAGSPLNQSTEACNNNNSQGMLSMPWK